VVTADVMQGAFLQTCSYHNELYGLSLEAVEIVARESLACVVHMELEVSQCLFLG